MSSKRHNTLQRLARKLLLQALFISAAAALSLYLTTFMLENILVTKALELESDFFWQEYEKDPNDIKLPFVYNLTGYLSDHSEKIPQLIKSRSPGIHEIKNSAGNKVYLHISQNNGKTLYLEYNNAQVNKLVAIYGIVPLIFVLMLLYISTWLAYRSTNQALSPLMWLARRVNTFKPYSSNAQDFLSQSLPADADEEVKILANALYKFTERIDAFVTRERMFTRDASHELRTPLTIINAATDMLLLDDNLSDSSRSCLNKIKHASTNMEDLIQALLMLAREEESSLEHEETSLNAVIQDEVDDAKFLALDKPIEIRLKEQKTIYVHAPKRVITALAGNLLRNAVSNTHEGYIEILISHGFIEVIDTGTSISKEELDNLYRPFIRGNRRTSGGFEVGLTIVNRILEQYDWLVEVDSEEGKGTKIKVIFPNARVEPIQSSS